MGVNELDTKEYSFGALLGDTSGNYLVYLRSTLTKKN